MLFKHLALARKDDINLQAGISDKTGTMTFYALSSDTLSTFSEHEARTRCEKNGLKIIDTLQIPVDTLKNVIDKYNGGIFPDFLSVDTEGLDEIILSSLKECSSRPKVICTETAEFSSSKNHIPEICSILEPLGYTLLLDNGLNSIFVSKDLWEEALTRKKA